MTAPTNKQTDSDLLVRYMAGDEDAFQELVNRYKNPLYAFLKRFLNRQELVEDVFQETFLQLYMSKESFDTSRPLRPSPSRQPSPSSPISSGRYTSTAGPNRRSSGSNR